MRRKSKSRRETMSREDSSLTRTTREKTWRCLGRREAGNETANVVCPCSDEGSVGGSLSSTFICGDDSRRKNRSRSNNISKQKTIRMLIEGRQRRKRNYQSCKSWFSIKDLSIHSPLRHLHNWTQVFFYILFLSGPCVQAKYFEESSEEIYFPGGRHNGGNGTEVGISPPVLNLASKAIITVNATCGQKEPETYCKLVEHVHSRFTRLSQCQVCDADSSDREKRHPVKYTIDGSNRWWQSPTLQNGLQYEWVTINIDLNQVYQVAYIIIKAAISPRPGNWVLERSLDGIHYHPWQYYAISDEECWNRYGIRAKPGKPSYSDDEEVICTSYFSRIQPFEGGEIHTSLVNGRPGADGPSEELTKFTMARYLRMRLQKIRTLHGDLMNVGLESRSLDKSVMRRYFYSIKDISIGGHCVCFGHASECVKDSVSHTERCMCQHNTCGDRCDFCCPLFNQYQWGAGNSTDSAACEACQCYGHADSCVYDPEIHSKSLSINSFGTRDGGGVCLNCKAHTAGVNCEKCETGFYRPRGVAVDDPSPCVTCECDSFGSMGNCVASEDELTDNKSPGDCICKEGFTGKSCNKCSMGYRGYPVCEPCPCNLSGIVNSDCEDDCVCKKSVMGSLCSECKKGFFNLLKDNPDGCTSCFCHGTTDKCSSSSFAISTLSDHDWYVTDLHGTKVIPAVQIGGLYHIANEEFASFGEYYWSASKSFSGKRIHSYGLNFTFHVSWVQARGDTSGRPIPHFDLIIQSTNSFLGFSHRHYDGSNATIHVTLNEWNCYVLPDVDNNIITTKKVSNTLGTPCTRHDVMEGISDIKRVLLRAKYHTDQIEGMLHQAFMETADTGKTLQDGEKVALSVEVCECPTGYAGSSCEECAYGYRKGNVDSWLNKCVKCDCNGHAKSCDPNGKCFPCDHNTAGAKCDLCATSFYGDATTGLETSCKPCECPLSVSSNNFSPTCSLSGSSYQCTACPKGYEGPFCERCSKGFYGNPTQPGDYCKPCECSNDDGLDDVSSDGNICDHLTGECLVCAKNTVGWNCDECMPGYYGNPLNGSCIPCECDAVGSSNLNCNPDSGQCVCQENFTGRKCALCLDGHGNPKEGCPLCGCNVVGSFSSDCNKTNGQCVCKFGIGGRYCNKCLELHFGFSSTGCSACDCHPDGADSSLCDLNNGQCHCMPNVKGRKCDGCAAGFWNLGSKAGCDRCSCDPLGSLGNTCDVATGQCRCKSGIGGPKCDTCLDKHYGFSASGCKECDPCDKEGYICEAENGRCVCPPNTEGSKCEKCTVGFWGFSASGCQACNCTLPGSKTPQCSPETGKCSCAAGFEGDKCNLCKFGHFNYPHCTPCGCDTAGTVGKYCDQNGLCSCTDTGQCTCKLNVAGQKCDRCKEGKYGLEADSPEGCMDCFCFKRTNRCSQGYFKWQRFGMLNTQKLMITRSPGSPQILHYDPFIRIEGQERCYSNLALPVDRVVSSSSVGRQPWNTINNLIVIPDQARDILTDKDISFSAPLYWQLPQIFLGDKVLSYNGFLRFRTVSIGGSSIFPPRVLHSYPLIQIQGNYKVILEHFPNQLSPSGYYEVKLHEDAWKRRNGPSNGIVTKEDMMVALQNLQHVLIRGTHTPEVVNASLYNVSLDIAIPSPNGDKSMAHGIEVCDCPPEYNSTSCQNPKVGFYRWYKREYITSTVIIDLIGQAKPCDCNGRSDVCDTETGYCQNCSNFTAGPKCDLCASGHYGNPLNRCIPCPCPNIWHNHADSCYKHPITNQFQCYCRKGYTGKTCDRCDYGFFGTPWETGGYCEPCKCNPYGSVSDECDEITGQCNCRPGVTGRDCSKCSDRHVIIGKTCTSCSDQCTGVLFKDVDKITAELNSVSLNPDAAAVWRKLAHFETESSQLFAKKEGLLAVRVFVQDLPTFENLAGILVARAGEITRESAGILQQARGSERKSDELLIAVNLINNDIRGVLLLLDDYVHDKIIPDINSAWAQEEAKGILNALKEITLDFDVLKIQVQEELEEAKDTYETVTDKITNASVVDAVKVKFKNLRNKLDDLIIQISRAYTTTDEAERVIVTATELLNSGRMNIETIDNMTLDMDMKTVMTSNTLSETLYLRKEIEQVLLMVEDILRETRNITKEVEIRDNHFFDFVPMHRATYAQPAFDHVEGLKQHSKYLERLFKSISLNGSRSIEAVTAYERMKTAFEKAFELAQNASDFSKESNAKIYDFLSEYSLDVMLESSSTLVEDGLLLSGIVENSLRNNFTNCQSSVDSLRWKVKAMNESLRNIFNQMEAFDENLRLNELINRIDEIQDTIRETSMDVMDTETKINNELLGKINSIKNGSAFDAIDVAVQVNVARGKINQLKRTVERVETTSKTLDSSAETLEDRMKYLRALIKQSRHKSNTVRVSIGPDETGTCFRLFKWPVVEDATSIRFNFAPTKNSDSLLFYWPSSINEDYIAIEMVNRQVRASWDLGAGVRTLNHPTKFSQISENSDDPDFWFEISLERVGSSVTLDVTKIQQTGKPGKRTSLEYKNSDDEATLMNLSPMDVIHIGGMSKQMRVGLVSNGLSGCIHNLQVNHRTVGLWNFVGNEGCAPCVECQDPSELTQRTENEYYFDGRGYAVVNRIQSKAFNSLVFDVNMEFRTYSESGLLFVTLNETIGQSISIELKDGGIVMKVRHRWNDQADVLKVETEGDKYNTGNWVAVRAIWVFQRGSQTAQITVNKKNFKQIKPSTGLSLELYNAAYQLGGVSPTFDPIKWKNHLAVIPFVGCLKNILIDSSSYDPLAGQYHGVESPCSGKTIYLTSFEGDGYGEFLSRPMSKDFKFGFSFKTLAPTGVLVLSTSNKLIKAESQHYYAVYLENGQIRAQIGVPNGGDIDLMSNGTRYDDGVYHSFRFVKKNKRFFIYMDDEEVVDIRFPRKPPTVAAATNGGLFIGGVSNDIQEKYINMSLPITRGFSGCVQNFYFGNELLNFNYPIAHQNQNLGQCPKHNDFEPTLIPNSFLFPTRGYNGISNRFEPIFRHLDPTCSQSSQQSHIPQEERFAALHFGDNSDSYATLALDGSKSLKQRFNLTFEFRTFYPNGMFFQGVKKKGNGAAYCLMSFLKDGQIIVKLHGGRPQDLVSPVSNLNDGNWHRVSIVKADDKMYLYVDSANASQTRVQSKIKPISRLHLGGVPNDGMDCLENSIQKPDYFKGCLRSLIINSHHYNLDTNTAVLHNVNPCFKNVQTGTFFRSGSYAIYSHNLTLGNLMELQLDFKSDSTTGVLLKFVPDNDQKYPVFSIFLEDGKVIARETIADNESYEAVGDFGNEKNLVCNGQWHTIRANYEKGSIALRVDNLTPIFALVEPVTATRLGHPNGNTVSGSVYIGGVEDGASRAAKKNQFNGCIKNISINRQPRDWTDMALLSNIYLNACPV